MKKVILTAMLWGGSLMAAPCTTTTLDVYTTTLFSCTLDQFTFKDFLFAVPAFSGVTPLTASAITVTPTITTTVNGDLLGLQFSSTGFSIGAGQSVTYDIRYNVDPQPDIIIEADDQLNTNTPVAPGFAIVLTKLCVGGQWLGVTPSCDVAGGVHTLTVFHMGSSTGNQLTDSVTFAAVNRVGYDNYIHLDGGAAGGGGSSAIGGFSNVTVTVPEPSAIAMFLTGAAFLALRSLGAKVR